MADDPEVLASGRWRMWAVRVGDWRGFWEPGHRRYAQMNAGRDEEVVPVLVTEDETGAWYGWLPTGEDVPVMLHPSVDLFRMCFPYGPEVEELRGRGRVLRLDVSAAD